jgi:hypothetical protein
VSKNGALPRGGRMRRKRIEKLTAVQHNTR